MSVTWERALADCEDRLDAASTVLERGGAAEIDAFTDPEVDGPLPAELAGRAAEIVARGEALERRITTERDRVRSELRRLPRMPPAERENRFDAQA